MIRSQSRRFVDRLPEGFRNPKIHVIKLIDNIIAELKKEQVVDESKQECCKAQVDQADDNDTDGSGPNWCIAECWEEGEFSDALEKDYEEVSIDIPEGAEEDEGNGDEWH